jgi:hypothetical protein
MDLSSSSSSSYKKTKTSSHEEKQLYVAYVYSDSDGKEVGKGVLLKDIFELIEYIIIPCAKLTMNENEYVMGTVGPSKLKYIVDDKAIVVEKCQNLCETKMTDIITDEKNNYELQSKFRLGNIINSVQVKLYTLDTKNEGKKLENIENGINFWLKSVGKNVFLFDSFVEYNGDMYSTEYDVYHVLDEKMKKKWGKKLGPVGLKREGFIQDSKKQSPVYLMQEEVIEDMDPERNFAEYYDLIKIGYLWVINRDGEVYVEKYEEEEDDEKDVYQLTKCI